MLAVPLVAVFVLHADAAAMGYLMAAGLVPNLLFSLHAGGWVDRRGGRRRVMLAADLARGSLLATIPLAFFLGILTMGQLYLVAFLVGTASVFFFVSYSTLFVSLVPRQDFVAANSLLNGSRAGAFIAGPGIGGVLVQLITAPLTVTVDALSFFVSAATLLRIRPREPAAAGEDSSLLEGMRFIFRSQVIRSALGATATVNLFNFIFSALFILYATTRLGLSAGLLGAVLACAAVGSLAGSFATGRISRRIGIGPTFMVGCAVFPAPMLLVPLAGGPKPLVAAMLFLSELGAGFGVMLLDISIASIFAAVIPDELRARVSGAYRTVNYGVRPIGSLLGGALGTVLGLRSALWIATVGGLLGVLWLLPSPVPRMRILPETPG